MASSKIHYKMYKHGKQWVYAGLIVGAVGVTTVGVLNTDTVFHDAPSVFASDTKTTDKLAPDLAVEDHPVWIGQKEDPINWATAYDVTADHDVTDSIKIIKGSVDFDKAGTYDLTYEATSLSGNKSQKTITVTVRDPNAKDTTPPEIQMNDIAVSVGDNLDVRDNISVYDELDENVSQKDIKLDGSYDTSKAGIYPITASVKDKSGNEAKTSFNVLVFNKDSNDPIMHASDVTLHKNDQWDALDHISTKPMNTDTQSIATQVKGDVDTSKPGKYEVTYTVNAYNKDTKKQVGKTLTKTITVTVLDDDSDTTAPVFKQKTNPVRVEVGQKFDPLNQGVTVYDAHDGKITPKVVSSNVNTNVPGNNYKVNYEAVDKAGNKSKFTLDVMVEGEADHEVPVITAQDRTIEVNSDFNPMQDVFATDNIEGKIAVGVTHNNVDTSTPGVYTVTYEAVDETGNIGTKSVAIKVVNSNSTDKTKPEIDVPKLVTIDDDNRKDFDDINKGLLKDVSATDDVDGKVDVSVIKQNVDINKKGTYSVTYQAVDKSGNVASATTDVRVVNSHDAVKPVISASELTLEVGQSFDPMQGVSAIDDVDGDVTVKLTEGKVDTNKAGTYQLTYAATDKAGNKATYTRTVTVVSELKDNVGPVFNETPSIHLPLNSTQVDFTNVTSAYDNFDKMNVTIKQVSSDVDTSKPGTYHVLLSAKDSSGNESTQQVTVIVSDKQDDSNIILTVSDGTIQVGDNFDIRQYYNAITANGEPINDIEVLQNEVNSQKVGTYTIKIKATDGSGAVSIKSAKITVTDEAPKDTKAPYIHVEDAVIQVGDKFDPMAEVTATDDVDGIVAVKLTEGKVDTNKAGTYHLNYTAVDTAGNKAKVTRDVVVNENDNKDVLDHDASNIWTDTGKTDTEKAPTLTDAINKGGVVEDATTGDDLANVAAVGSANNDVESPASMQPVKTVNPNDNKNSANQAQPLANQVKQDAEINKDNPDIKPLANTGAELTDNAKAAGVITVITGVIIGMIAFMWRKLKHD